MQELRVDAGKVEISDEFQKTCDDINGIGVPGIKISPAAPEKQNQNTVERHIQTIENQITANLIDQDLLTGSWWGIASISVWKVRNAMSNSLCPNTTPLFEMEGRYTNVNKMFQHKYGQSVICSKTGNKDNNHHISKNEFGVVVGPGHPDKGTSLVYLPEHGHFYIAPRYKPHAINLGTKSRLTIEDGKKLLPVLNKEGEWEIKTRGDNNFLANKYEIYKDYINNTEEKDSIITSKLNSSLNNEYEERLMDIKNNNIDDNI